MKYSIVSKRNGDNTETADNHSLTGVKIGQQRRK